MILDRGDHEEAKAVLHGIAAVLLGTFALYSVAAALRRWRRTGVWEPHLAFNAVVYTVATAGEGYQVAQHVEQHSAGR